MVIIFVKHPLGKSNRLWGALRRAHTQKLPAHAGAAFRRILVGYRRAKDVSTPAVLGGGCCAVTRPVPRAPLPGSVSAVPCPC